MTSRSSAAARSRDARPARDEALEIGRDRLHRRLLQHDLRTARRGRDRAGRRRARSFGPTRQGSRRACRSYQASSVGATPGALRGVARFGLAGAGGFASLAGIAPMWLPRRRLARAEGASSTVPHPSRPAAKPVAELIGKSLDPIARKRGLARAELLAWWPDIVGAAYAGRTAPERIRWPRDGKAATLVVRCDPSLALQFAHETDRVRERLNAYFGYPAVGAVRIVQQRDRNGRRASRQDRPRAGDRSGRMESRLDARRRAAAATRFARSPASVLARS